MSSCLARHLDVGWSKQNTGVQHKKCGVLLSGLMLNFSSRISCSGRTSLHGQHGQRLQYKPTNCKVNVGNLNVFLPVLAPCVTRAKMSRLWGGKKAKPKGDKCSFCHQIIAKDKTHSGMFYTVAASEDDEGGPIHSECWEAYHEKTAVKCLHCNGPVAQLPGRFNGKHYRSTDPPGRVHSECWEAYNSAKPPKETCTQCKQPLEAVDGKFSGEFVAMDDGVKLHAECRSAYHAEHTEKCLQCSEPVAPEKGKFSGEFMELEEKGRVHSECFDEYSEATAEKCLVCKEAVRKKEGFSGYFVKFDHGKVHKECNSEYQEMVADKCLHCNKGVRKAGDFSGTFYPIDRKLGEAEGEEGELKVHMECWEAYEAKIAAEREGAA